MAEDKNPNPETEPTDELSPDEEANFGGQPEGSEPAGYIANFEGDEVDGHRYKMGERLKDNVDAGTIAYLVQNGRFTPTTSATGGSPSGGDNSDPAIPNETGGEGGGDDAFAGLTDDQKAEAEKLKADNTRDELLKIAEDEGVTVESDDNKTDLAAKIVATRATE